MLNLAEFQVTASLCVPNSSPESTVNFDPELVTANCLLRFNYNVLGLCPGLSTAPDFLDIT